MDYSTNRTNVIHELTHLVDTITHGDFQSIPINKTQNEWNDKDVKRYFNHAYERNAYFVEASAKIFKHIKTNREILDDFDVFLSYMKLGGPGNAFDNMTDKNKKKFVSRCYMLFDTLNN